jgi:hypothetical protein
MIDKRTIDMDELKEALRKVYYDKEAYWDVCEVIDSLAQPIEPVKTEAIEACIRAYVGDLAKVAEAELEAIKGRMG